jgi:amino acid transporter
MIGAGIFALPASVTNLIGVSSPLAYLIAGAAVLLIALCFAEAGSLFESSGGPYVYARTAFGSLIGFEVGWMFVLARLTAAAAISNTFADYLGYLHAPLAQGPGRVAAITLSIVALTWINCVGIRPGTWAINILTVGKLAPLLLFCLVGIFFVDPARVSFLEIPQAASLQQASLLLIFAFGGFEFASVPSEEVINPRRAIPLALIASVCLVVVLYLAIQVVAMGTLPTLAASRTPLASAASVFLGAAGGLLMTVGAVLSTTGTSSASILVGPRMLYALANGGLLPPVLGRVHPRYRTPVVAIVSFSIAAAALALSGTFTQLAAMSALARLLFYSTTCVAVLVLRRKMPASERRFTLPGGPVVPVLGAGICLWLLSGSSRTQTGMTALALVAGLLLYLAVTRLAPPASGTDSPSS